MRVVSTASATWTRIRLRSPSQTRPSTLPTTTTRRTPMARRTRQTPQRDPRQELVDLASDLNLTALAATFPDILSRAETEKISFTDFALALLRAEANARQQRFLQRILKTARLGAVQGMDGYNFSIRLQLD